MKKKSTANRKRRKSPAPNKPTAADAIKTLEQLIKQNEFPDDEWFSLYLMLWEPCLRLYREKGNKALGMFVFQTAQFFSRYVAFLCKEPPQWLVEMAKTETEVPWIMAFGKPTRNFENCDARLKWGSAISKRGKSSFSAQATRDVISELQYISERRLFFLENPLALELTEEDMVFDDPAERRQIAELPPLSKESIDEWWEVIKKEIRRNTTLPDAYKNSIAASVGNADSSIMNEHLKRCKRAFYALVP